MRPAHAVASATSLGPRERVLEVLRNHLSAINAMAILRVAEQRASIDPSGMREADLARIVGVLKSGLTMFLAEETARARCAASLDELTAGRHISGVQGTNVLRIEVSTEDDVVAARLAGRQIAQDVGFRIAEHVKIATAISELARNIVLYAKHGTIEIRRIDSPQPGIEIAARDNGPGIPNVDAILSGRYKSKLGMGLGLRGTKNLMDEMHIETALGVGTTVRVRKILR